MAKPNAKSMKGNIARCIIFVLAVNGGSCVESQHLSQNRDSAEALALILRAYAEDRGAIPPTLITLENEGYIQKGTLKELEFQPKGIGSWIYRPSQSRFNVNVILIGPTSDKKGRYILVTEQFEVTIKPEAPHVERNQRDLP